MTTGAVIDSAVGIQSEFHTVASGLASAQYERNPPLPVTGTLHHIRQVVPELATNFFSVVLTILHCTSPRPRTQCMTES